MLGDVPYFPKVTVITVVLNAVETVEDTLNSVINQTYPNLEYIVIDGGSTDGTLKVLMKYQEKITWLISEKDRGIYDAMNKGLIMARGDWVNFMNSGDKFYDHDVLMRIFGGGDISADVLYGDVHIRYLDFERIEKAKSHETMWRGMRFSHQSTFVRLVEHQRHLFDIKNLISADLKFLYSAFLRGNEFKYVNQVVASVSIGGLSDVNRIESISSARDAICAYHPSYFLRLYFYWLILDCKIRRLLKIILPKSLIKKIIINK